MGRRSVCVRDPVSLSWVRLHSDWTVGFPGRVWSLDVCVQLHPQEMPVPLCNILCFLSLKNKELLGKCFFKVTICLSRNPWEIMSVLMTPTSPVSHYILDSRESAEARHMEHSPRSQVFFKTFAISIGCSPDLNKEGLRVDSNYLIKMWL